MSQNISKEDFKQNDNQKFLPLEEKDLSDNMLAMQWIHQLLFSIDQTIEKSDRKELYGTITNDKNSRDCCI